MFQLLGNWLTGFLSGYVGNIVSTLCSDLAPIALIWVTVYIALYGFAVMRGQASAPVAEFGWKMIKISFILTFALGAGNYMNVVFGTANGLQDSLATVFLGNGAYVQGTPTTVFGSLDNANDTADALLKTLWVDAGITRLDLVFASLIFDVGIAIFLIIGLVVTLISKMILAFALALGPISILSLLFKPTSKFFDAWLSFVLSAIVLSAFVFFALGLSLFVQNKLISVLNLSGAFSPTGAVNVVVAASTYFVIVVALAVVLWQSPHYASALTGGATIGTGLEAAAGFMAGRSGNGGGGGQGNAGGGAGGGSIGKGGGVGYAAGRMTAAGVQAAADVGKAGISGARAAYQRVAKLAQRK